MLRASTLGVYALALAVPIIVFFRDRHGTAFLAGSDARGVLQALFPLVGLYAFTFVTAQVLITTNLRWLRRLWPGIIRYHRAQGIFALVFAITHPLFILVGYGTAVMLSHGFVRPGLARWLIPSYTALIILLFTVSTALLAWSRARITWWRALHRLNYLVFALVWVHSWFIGTDTPTTTLRVVWIFYLAVVVASVIGRYAFPGPEEAGAGLATATQDSETPGDRARFPAVNHSSSPPS
jgi:DMSO/TMAO reductase YedYZ heme-binding membrane subunit